MHVIRSLLILFVLSLTACGGGEGTPVVHYDQPGKPGGRMCTFQCRNALDHCQQSCNLQERSCVNAMQAQAIKDYEAYTVDQFKLRAPIELRPRDFERPEQCFPTKCRDACESSYKTCFEKCGGKISTSISSSSCSFFCF